MENGVSKIIVGNNKDWKRGSKLSKKVNQSFVGIPHQEFINKLIYKGKDVGIEVVLAEESYTSGTSFLDNEEPIKTNYNKSRRKFRGLFVSNQGIKISMPDETYEFNRDNFSEGLIPALINLGKQLEYRRNQEKNLEAIRTKDLEDAEDKVNSLMKEVEKGTPEEIAKALEELNK